MADKIDKIVGIIGIIVAIPVLIGSVALMVNGVIQAYYPTAFLGAASFALTTFGVQIIFGYAFPKSNREERGNNTNS